MYDCMQYFNEMGFESFAYSLRGTSGTGLAPTENGTKTIDIENHISDLSFVIDNIRLHTWKSKLPPIIISHSLGGIICMKYLEEVKNHEKVSGAIWLCSVPPSGNGPMTSRYISSRFLDAIKIVWGFVFKAATFDTKNCKELFFDENMKESDIHR